MNPSRLLPWFCACLVLTGADRPLLIRKVRIFDGIRLLQADSVLVADGRIQAVGQGLQAPAGAQVLDGQGCTLLPGLIDAHVHSFGDALRQNLAFGVTTVLDMFSEPGAMRAAKARQDPAEADLRSAGLLATCPGGHGTEYPVQVPTLQRPDQAEAWVQARIQEGSDFIKIVYDDGSSWRPQPTLSLATVRALIRAAHRHGKAAVVHIGDQKAAREVLAAGADGLVHVWLDAARERQLAALARRQHAFVVPTLAVYRPLAADPQGIHLLQDPALAPYLALEARASLAFPGYPASSGVAEHGYYGHALAAVRALHQAGVPLLAGTDAPNTGTAQGASLHGELQLLVAAGLSATEALRAATSVPAHWFKLADRGRIAPGMRADLLLVKGDPTRDILATRQIQAIWKAGLRFDREDYRQELAELSRVVAEAPLMPAGLISDFHSEPKVCVGAGWFLGSDDILGGASTATLETLEDPQSGWALKLSGRIDPGLATAFAGALWMPGGTSDLARNFTALHALRFRARSEAAGSFCVMFTTLDHGYIPLIKRFQAGPQWREVLIPLAGLPLGAVNVVQICAGPKPGPFTLFIAALRCD